ncbi:hypothetical protein [Bacillus sp. 1P06AnD]|uniref:hypothetical protein n=1 Tax=Bacillus sp. 1P06AnD TaxID=3132208 RepID=UPI00399FC28D
MDWLKEISEEEYWNLQRESKDVTRPEIKVISNQQEGNNITEIAQFIIAPSLIYNTDVLSYFPITNKSVYNIIKDEVYPHFKVIQELKFSGELRAVQVKSVKNTSLEQFKAFKYQVHPYIQELYFKNPFHKMNSHFQISKKLLFYEVIKDGIISQVRKEDTLLSFIKKTYLDNNNSCYTIQPIGWKLDENLRNSKVISELSNIANKVIICIDNESNIVKFVEFNNYS